MQPVKVFKTVVQDEIIPCVDRMEFQTMNMSKFVDIRENLLIEAKTTLLGQKFLL